MIRDHYNQLTVDLRETAVPHRLLWITFRVYDEGVAFCYTIPKQPALDRVTITKECTEFHFTADHTTWETYAAQGNYKETTVSRIKRGCERPLTVRAADDVWLALGERGWLTSPE